MKFLNDAEGIILKNNIYSPLSVNIAYYICGWVI